MSFTLTLMGLAIYTLIWEKLPEWGNWFNWIVERLPKPLAYLYDAWHCPFCFGFWVALLLHAVTGLTTIEALKNMPIYMGVFAPYLSWFLDALATAMLIMFAKLVLSALAVPAIKGHQMTQEFHASMKEQ